VIILRRTAIIVTNNYRLAHSFPQPQKVYKGHRHNREAIFPQFGTTSINVWIRFVILWIIPTLDKKLEMGYSRKVMPKRTHQPHTRHRAKTHGFRARISTKAGRAVLKRRRIKGRAKVSI
jgi:large subunit ribosomal protein L34